MLADDKAISSAVENCNKEEKSFVYDIIRQNFLVSDTAGMSEDERQASISLGIKKAQYAADMMKKQIQKHTGSTKKYKQRVRMRMLHLIN